MGGIKDMLSPPPLSKHEENISPPSPQDLRPWWQVQSIPVDSDSLCAAAPVFRQQDYLSLDCPIGFFAKTDYCYYYVVLSQIMTV